MEGYIRKPSWLKIKLPLGKGYKDVRHIVEGNNLNTICESGRCPNMAECWGCGTATFMVMGDICTRSCKFCATKTGVPKPLDRDEPANIARSVKLMKLKHCVVTSVDRDDLLDGGASHWVDVIDSIKRENPETTIEVLIPDFSGDLSLVRSICDSKPNIVSHNLETVSKLTDKIRSKADYKTSLKVIEAIAKSGVVAKSGIMVGLGESEAQVIETMKDLVSIGCEVFTIGQYLQPTKKHLAVTEYVTPEQFDRYRDLGLELGFRVVESAPLVRSSYHAERHI